MNLDVLDRELGPLSVGGWAVVGVLAVGLLSLSRVRHRPNRLQQDTASDAPFTSAPAQPPVATNPWYSSLPLRRRLRAGGTEDAGHNAVYIGADPRDWGDLLTTVSQRNGGRASMLIPLSAIARPGPINPREGF